MSSRALDMARYQICRFAGLSGDLERSEIFSGYPVWVRRVQNSGNRCLKEISKNSKLCFGVWGSLNPPNAG
jgi:hypothetical protein